MSTERVKVTWVDELPPVQRELWIGRFRLPFLDQMVPGEIVPGEVLDVTLRVRVATVLPDRVLANWSTAEIRRAGP